jgi:hypothetical protein
MNFVRIDISEYLDLAYSCGGQLRDTSRLATECKLRPITQLERRCKSLGQLCKHLVRERSHTATITVTSALRGGNSLKRLVGLFQHKMVFSRVIDRNKCKSVGTT